MSASTERKNRQAAREAGTDKKQIAAQEAAKKAAVSKRRWTIGGIAVILLIAMILFLGSPALYRVTKAETIGSKSYSPAELKYLTATISNTQNYMYTYYLQGEEAAQQYVQSQLTLSAAELQYARENNISLSEKEKSSVEDVLQQIRDAAKNYGMSVSAFTGALYGKGVNLNVVRSCLENNFLAQKAYFAKFCSLEFEQADLDAKIAGLADDGTLYSYAYYMVPITEERPEAEAKYAAEAVLVGYQEGEDEKPLTLFADAVDHEFPEETPTAFSAVAASSIDASYRDWVTQADRLEGDVVLTQDQDGQGYVVLVFLGRYEQVAQVRHILITAEADEDGNYTDEAKEAARVKAEEIRDAWLAGNQTEAEFASLAYIFSEDPGSSENGGLMSKVLPGQTVEEFDRFCFAPHEYGDVEIVYGESTQYAGYHIIFFIGVEKPAVATAKSELASEAMEAWRTEITEGLEPVYHWAYKLA